MNTREPMIAGHPEYSTSVAATIDDRIEAWGLVYRRYCEKQYAGSCPDGLWYSLFDALPETTTFLVRRAGLPVATLTVVFDSPLGLPADELYGPELNRLRRDERVVCEIVSLVSDETSRQRCAEVLRHLFGLAYLTARRLEGASDFVITVNPHHAAYYERKLLFSPAGGVRSYAKVGGAPAVLLRLDLETAEERYARELGPEVLGCFTDPRTDQATLRWLQAQRAPLEERDVQTWFEEKRPLLSQAAPSVRDFLTASCAMARGLAEPTGYGRVWPKEYAAAPEAETEMAAAIHN